MGYVQAKGTTLSIPLGNTKLGAIPSFSTLAHVTCPGASDWCRQVCYAQNLIVRYKGTAAAYQRNTDARGDAGFVDEIVRVINAYQWPEFRIHISGDFDSHTYTMKWALIMARCPDTQFWAYTRSWVDPDILPALIALHDLPNVQLFASVDPTMASETPPGWRVAFIQGDDRYTGMTCLEQREAGSKAKMPDCDRCGYCQRKQRGNVRFIVH